MKKVYMVCYSEIGFENGAEYLTKGIYIRKSAAESQVKLNYFYTIQYINKTDNDAPSISI